MVTVGKLAQHYKLDMHPYVSFWNALTHHSVQVVNIGIETITILLFSMLQCLFKNPVTIPKLLLSIRKS